MMIKPTVVIHVDALRREYPANYILAKRLEARGYRVTLTSRATTSLLLKIITPDIVILSHVFTLPPMLLADLYSRGSKIYVNEVEGEIEGNEVGVSGTYPQGVPYQYFSKIFTWSQWSADWAIREHNIDASRVSAIGSTRLSLLKYFSRKPDRSRVGIISRFETINTFDGRHPFANLMDVDTKSSRGRMFLQRALIEMEGFSITSQIIDALVEKRIPVSIRPHPNEAIEPYKLLVKKHGPIVEIDTGSDYMHWLEQLSAVVGTLSSAYTEPYLLKIPIISIEFILENKYSLDHMNPFVETFSRACHKPSNVAEVVQLCSDPDLSPIKDSELDRSLAKTYFLNSPLDPVDNMLAWIDEASSRNNSLLGFLVPLLNLLIDLARIARCIFCKNPKQAFRSHLIYNYSPSLHGPSEFMRRIEMQAL